ncbi:unnamed protein product, partial [Ectocarpus sp. 12 AP-2014]
GEGYVAEKAESNTGWLFPVGDESHELGYPHMFTDMFTAIEEKRDPLESFYDGYVVNAILDAAFKSAETKLWEPVVLEDWRGDEPNETEKQWQSYDDEHYLIKEEILPNGDVTLILKHKTSGEISRKVTMS